jgi:hypothetical protein
LLMIFCNERMSLQPSFPWAAFAAIFRKSKARAARLFRARDLSWRDKNCPGPTKSGQRRERGQRDSGGNKKKEESAHTTAPARAASPLAKGKRMSIVEF